MRRSMIVLLACAFLVIGRTSMAFAQTPSRGGTLSVGLVSDPVTLDPAKMGSFFELSVQWLIYEPLLHMTSDLKIEPGLAEKWTVSKDTIYTFTLRPGLTFHDGTALDAEAVKANFDGMLNPETGSPRRGELGPVESVKVTGPLAVQIALSRPYGALPRGQGIGHGEGVRTGVRGGRRQRDRWKSTTALFQWIYVDLGVTYTVERVVVRWGPFYATTFHIQALDSSGASTNMFSTTACNGGTYDVPGLNRNARYVRILCTARNTADSGYVIRELEVYGRRPSSTAVDERTAMTRVYALEQNYPNPFNGATQIGFQIPEAAWVSLRVYDILGRKVAVLANEQMPAGRHNIRLDASRLASGVYAYRLHAGPYVATRRLMLLR